MTPAALTIRAATMRPIASAEDAFAAAQLLGQAASDNPDSFFELVPSGATANPVELAADESVAVFECTLMTAGSQATVVCQSAGSSCAVNVAL